MKEYLKEKINTGIVAWIICLIATLIFVLIGGYRDHGCIMLYCADIILPLGILKCYINYLEYK